MNDPSQSSSQAIYHQPTYSAQAGSELETAYNQYQMGLKRLFQHVRDEQLSETGTLLINISNWLLNNVEPLGKLAPNFVQPEQAAELNIGLVLDDESVHPERLQLWENFNTCWLSTLQKQKEVTQTIVDSGQKLPKSLITHDKLDTMGKELVRLCDLIEKHGLVDYQMGVWEEEIIASQSATAFSRFPVL